MNSETHPAVFIDRDGVIIKNRSDYVLSWDQVEPYPASIQALARLHGSIYKVVLVTNQSAIGRGLISLPQVQEINRRLVALIEGSGGRIDGVFVCPHHPKDECACRKPRPGLILEAAQTMALDLSRSIMVGDAVSDLQAGRSAGVATLALVRTGLGGAQEPQLAELDLGQVRVFNDLAEAMRVLIPAGGVPGD